MGFVVPIVIAYLLGSIPFGLLVSRWYGVPDIRQHGSGNIGATNVWRVVGAKAALWVYLGDIAKGAAAVGFARYFHAHLMTSSVASDGLLVACALAAVLGHMFSLFLRFKGGKGVNTALGAMLMLLPLETAASFIIFIAVVTASRYISLGSLAGAVGFFLIVAVEKYVLSYDVATIYVYVAGVVAVLIVIAHRQNIRRLIAGTESRFVFSRKSEGKL